jgi:uncharacterized membrane-anchored protein
MNRAIHQDVLSKVPEVTVVFWITKIAATTLGETGGDSITMTLDWGYLFGTLLFLGLLIALVIAQIVSEKFHPFLYWSTIALPPPSAPRWPTSPTARSASVTRAAPPCCSPV